MLSVILPTKLNKQDQVKLGQTKTIILNKGQGHHVIAGIDLNTIPGQYLLTIQSKKQQLGSINYIVAATQQQFLTSSPNQNSLKDSNTIKRALIWSNIAPKLPLTPPAKGAWDQSFGQYYEKFLNTKSNNNFIQNRQNKNRKKLKSLHRVDHVSLTIASPLDIISPSDAICFLIYFDDDYGYTVLLDHGMGLFSEISGLDNLTISEQDKIAKGSTIASFNKSNFISNNSKTAKNKTIQWRVFLTKSIINPFSLTKPL